MTEQDKYTRWLMAEAQKGRMSRRDFLGRSSALGLSMVVGTGLFNEASAAMPKKGGHMRMAMGATLTNGLQWVVAYGVANTLTELDASGALVGSLATEWSSSADAATWTFKLRKGVEFHNGKTMTVEDVIASINYHRGEKSTSIAKPLVASVTDIKADGDDTIVISLSDGNADFPFNFNEAPFGIYPEKDGSIDWKAGGSGPYILTEEKAGLSYKFKRNPNYWGCNRPGRTQNTVSACAEFENHHRGRFWSLALHIPDADQNRTI
jgi:peptide/nickel transport system substrate-binding protein